MISRQVCKSGVETLHDTMRIQYQNAGKISTEKHSVSKRLWSNTENNQPKKRKLEFDEEILES